MHCLKFLFLLDFALVLLAVPMDSRAQANLPIYTDHLVNGFQDWSWATRNLANTSPTHSGANSISVSANNYQGISFHQSDFDTSVYSNLSFWAHGGTNGGQLLQVSVVLGTNDQPAYAGLASLSANTWKQYTIPLSSLNAANKTNLSRITIQWRGGATNTFYVDEIQLNAKPAPALVHVSVSATQTIRSVDSRWFAVNTAVWDNNFDTPQTVSFLNEIGTLAMRFPGGSLSDEYHWASNKTLTNTWTWATSFANFVHVATNIGAQAFITVNYGSGTPGEAAAWVRHANVTNHYGFRYWEIGNENYGTWETDTNASPNDAYTYAVRARDYLQQMKAADPTIKVGVVVAPGEDSYDNGYRGHPAVNPRTAQTHYGWTPVLLATLKSLGVTPDFFVHHRYPEYTGQESDPLLLQSASAWAGDAADLRQQVTDYFGAAGTNIELVCTENNSNSGQGRQSTSLVNGLYFADSLGQLMKTEFNAFVWWDLRNGTDTSGTSDPTLYGWRTFGDMGIINGLSTKLPVYYAAKLMRYFARPGDMISTASSDYPLISAYASRPANGAVSLLVINRDSVTNLTTQIALNGFTPAATATFRSFGIPQDEAARTNGPAASQDLSVTNFPGAAASFTNVFPPLSISLFTFSPSAPSLVAFPAAAQAPGQFAFQLQGQPGVRYYLQTSTNLTAWTTIATNILTGPSLNLTNAAPASAERQFWRALWQP